MKKVEITGVAKVHGTKEADGGYANIEINGIKIDNLLAAHMLEREVPDGEKYISETSICKVSITIEPYNEVLSVNGNQVPLEL